MPSAVYLDAVAKPQYVRLIDVFLLGPALLYTATILSRDRPLLHLFLAVAGAGTIYYNARNYLDIQRRIAEDTTGRMATDAWARLP